MCVYLIDILYRRIDILCVWSSRLIFRAVTLFCWRLWSVVKTSGITQMFKLLLFTDESHCEKYNRVNVFGFQLLDVAATIKKKCSFTTGHHTVILCDALLG